MASARVLICFLLSFSLLSSTMSAPFKPEESEENEENEIKPDDESGNIDDSKDKDYYVYDGNIGKLMLIS